MEPDFELFSLCLPFSTSILLPNIKSCCWLEVQSELMRTGSAAYDLVPFLIPRLTSLYNKTSSREYRGYCLSSEKTFASTRVGRGQPPKMTFPFLISLMEATFLKFQTSRHGQSMKQSRSAQGGSAFMPRPGIKW